MISESLFSFLEETAENKLEAYRKHEGKVFKNMHRQVIEDDGFPTLDKKHFKTPGYKKIVDHDSQSVAEKIIK